MAESVLSKLVKTDKETKEHLESIDSNLVKVYKLQLKTEKREAKQAKREAQRKKRSGGDFLQTLKIPEKDKKKVRKGFFESIGDFFKSLGKGLMGGLGGLLKNLFKVDGPLTSIITKFFGSVFTAGGELAKGIGKAIGFVLKSPFFWKAALVAGIAFGGMKLFNTAATKYDQSWGGKGTTRKGTGFYGQDIQGLQDEEAQRLGLRKGPDGKMRNRDGTVNERQLRFNKLHKQMDIYHAANNGIEYIDRETLPHNRALLEIAKEEGDVNRQNAILDKIDQAHQNRARHVDRKEKAAIKIVRLLERLQITDEMLILHQLSQGRRSPEGLPSHLSKQQKEAILSKADFGNAFTNTESFTEYYDSAPRQKLQTGGPLTVPGSGSGDKVPMMLPEGSFVMNRNAAQMGYQTGGIPKFQSGGMIPTLLEPGEHVYAPGQWDASHVLMNNQIPRFQSGGFVGTPRTGMVDTGYKDAKGRAILLSPAAAKGFKDMVNAGMPMNPGDVTNVFRDEAEYNRLIQQGYSPAANSHHNHGEAADIHGAMNQWIRANGAQYGWYPNDYSGSHGGHFEYKGPGAGTTRTSSNSNPDGGAGGQTSGGGGGGGILSGLMNIGGEFGDFLKHVAGSMAGLTGELAGLGQGLFGGLGLGGGGTDGGGGGGGGGGDFDVSDASAPLSGGLAATAKQMYDYIKAKGYSDAQAKGIVANIQRESTFDIDAVGDHGTSFGLFQWHAGRGSRMKAAVPNWATNWQGQIDYALQEHVGPKYKGDTAGMSAKDAAYWWMNKWEIPEDRARGGPNHRKMNGFIDAYQFQRGGRVSRAGQLNNYQMSMQHSLRRHLGRSKKIHVMPQIEPSRPSSNANPGAQNQPPVLDAYPTNVVAMDLAYRTSIGGVF